MTTEFINSKYMPDFLHWIQERELVRVRRERGDPPPWTKDEIIATTRFCNVRREDDKVTRWIRDNWRDPYQYHPNLAFAMCVARVINWPSTLEFLGFPKTWNEKAFVHSLDARQDRGEKIWTGAYMVTGGYSAGGETKQTIMGRVLSEAFPNAAKIRAGESLQSAHHTIAQTRGLGSFLGAQVIADLKYTPLLVNAVDWDTFCAPGPGSLMGLNFLHGREPKCAHVDFVAEVNEIRVWLQENVGIKLTAHDVQNCLCEFSKYVRIKYMNGRAKNGYRARR